MQVLTHTVCWGCVKSRPASVWYLPMMNVSHCLQWYSLLNWHYHYKGVLHALAHASCWSVFASQERKFYSTISGFARIVVCYLFIAERRDGERRNRIATGPLFANTACRDRSQPHRAQSKAHSFGSAVLHHWESECTRIFSYFCWQTHLAHLLWFVLMSNRNGFTQFWNRLR